MNSDGKGKGRTFGTWTPLPKSVWAILPPMKEVSPAEGRQLVEQGALLVDVREPEEYASVHAEGAQLVPLSEFEARYSELPKDKTLVMICRSGARSQRAGELLLEQGYGEVVNLRGGTNAWVEDGLPVVRGGA